jgi:carboxyl-terminal processing protease
MFDRLPNLPTNCIAAAAWTPDRIVAFAADTFEAFYPRSAERKLDWKARRAAALAQVSPTATDFQLWTALSSLMTGLDDPHVELHGVVDGARRDLEPGDSPTLTRVRATDPAGDEKVWLQAYREGILTQVLQGRGRQAANNRIFWGRVDDIGYLNLVTMGAFARNAAPDDPRPLDAALDEAFAAFAGAKAVIVDVSNNRGGYDTISQRVAARFAAQPRVAYSKVGVGAKAAPQPVASSRPAAGFTGPVYLVTSDITVSAGETFTLMMKALPNVKQVGAEPRGGVL